MKATEKAELHILGEICQISNSADVLAQKIRRTVDVIARGMGKDGASVFLIDRSGKAMTLTAAVGLKQETVGKVRFPIGAGIAGWVAQQKVPLALEELYLDPLFSYLPEADIEKFKSLLATPILDEENCLGVIFVLSIPSWRATSSDIMLLTTTANQLAAVIKSSQMFHSLQDRLTERDTIYKIVMALTSTLDLEQILSLVAKNSMYFLRAQGCAIRLINLPEIPSRRTFSSYSIDGDVVSALDAKIGSTLAELVSQEKKSILIPDVTREPSLLSIAELNAGSAISAPLIFRDKVLGVITLYNKQEGQLFHKDDLQFLTTVAAGAASAVENAAMYKRMEDLAIEARTRAQELSSLYDIGTAMSTTLNLDRLLRIILTAATMGGSGFGFNRALLFLTNERTNMLQGMMGVGPTSWEEAGRAWSAVALKHKSLMEWIQTDELFENKNSSLNDLARSIRVQLEPNAGVLAITVLNKKPYIITDSSSNPLVPKELKERLQVDNFATVPLVSKDRVIGIILVDNMFNRRPITDSDIRFFSLFAHQAALAIENAIIHTNLETMNKDMRSLHEQLVQSEKMAALGAMIAEITHEIRNPLVSIGGFTRRLAKKIQDAEDKKYTDIILSEVSRLEGILQDNLSYVKESALQLSDVDINDVMQEILLLYESEFIQRGIRVQLGLSSSVPRLMVDVQQIKQAVINVVKNAMEAMENGGTISISTCALPDLNEVSLEIADTGPGIPAKILHNIFNPYYSTKPRGTGLGLPITNRIIRAHKGKIEIRNKDSGGVIFTIKLPVQDNAAHSI
ncbi:MAG TPA: GAF domain-containing protein [Nitrospirota bacterium]|nr:GAF domain-containing protein [Nitrospirota bacterium]